MNGNDESWSGCNICYGENWFIVIDENYQQEYETNTFPMINSFPMIFCCDNNCRNKVTNHIFAYLISKYRPIMKEAIKMFI